MRGYCLEEWCARSQAAVQMVFFCSFCQPTAFFMAASTDALGMFLLLHCSIIWAKFIFSSGLGPPSANQTKIEINLVEKNIFSLNVMFKGALCNTFVGCKQTRKKKQ